MPVDPRITNLDWEEDLRRLRWRLAAAALFLAAITLIGIVGYKLISPGSSWVDAFYMTAITLTTVGFGEIIELENNPAGRIFTAGLIMVGMGGVLYFVSTTTAFVLEGQLGQVFWRRRMQKAIDRLKDHIIVCGSGGTAFYTAEELVSVRRPLVVITDDREAAAGFKQTLEGVPIIVGDPSSDETLLEAGVERAAGLIAATDNDKENLVITLSARQLSPSVRVVARVSDITTTEKIRKVGADAVVSPTHIGSLRLASEMIRPTVVSFLDTMLRDRDLNLRIDEVTIPEGSPAVGRRLEELGVDEVSNALLMAVRYDEDDWMYNPPASLEVTPGTVLIFLASPGDLQAICEALEGTMVSKPVEVTA